MDSDKYLRINKKDLARFSTLSDLNEISQIPEQLYYYGNIDLLYAKKSGARILCVIGSRKGTSYGKEAVDFLVSGLAGYNIIIISGLALGIDSAAHRAALKYKLRTITFPGSGLDDEVLYPQSNVKLQDEIISAGGGAISEYESNSRSQIYYFPARNRLMAAISDLVLVVEAEEKSGTQITARLALEYNREVAIVPGSIFSAYSRGTANLFKDGAHPVTCSDDILYLLKLKSPESNDTNGSQTTLFAEDMSIYDDRENIILKLLKAPLQKEELIESSGLLAHEALIALTTLEAKGVIKDNFGEIIRVR